MNNVADELIESLNLYVLERLQLPGYPERRAPCPHELLTGNLTNALCRFTSDNTMWLHQSLALRHLLKKENIVIATGTASGKSLIFQLFAFYRILQDEQAKVIVFYPLKALASDQLERWCDMAKIVGFGSSSVVKIDGDMPTTEREKALDTARVVLMTPDVCQAWLMRNVGSGLVRRFLERLVLLVLDETHVYESVFGSNVAFLLRRMISSRLRASRPRSNSKPFQIIAATATIRDPADHLNRLTGLRFTVIDEKDNGAPFYPREVIHINGAPYGISGESAVTDLARGVRALSTRRRFIAFVDSRQGVERTVLDLGEDGVMPYRSGYEAEDRKRIELALRSGSLDGVVATSALELGIDIADMEIGLNLGVPESRKAFRQRIGRVGRTGPGVFFVIAPPSAFLQFGETFKDYYEGSVEPSYLYLGNRFIQFAHAKCLCDEMEVLGSDQASLPQAVDWPDGFTAALKIAKPGAGRPREYDLIAQIGADAPHINYPLRQVGEATFDIKEGRGDSHQRIGTISMNQAIREAYPGAKYLHMGRAYKVMEWRTRSLDRCIHVTPSSNPLSTKPMLRKTASFSLSADGIVQGRIKRGPDGLLAEVHLQVNESVEGFTMGRDTYPYRELRAENPNMSRKQRDFRTTGVVLIIGENWFAGTQNAEVRERVAKGLMGLISRDRSISPRDIDATYTNIALLTEGGPRRLTDAVVVYDSVYGGLRLTEDLFIEFERYITQLDKAAKLAGDDAIVNEDITAKLIEWTKEIALISANNEKASLPTPDGWLHVYKPGSVVSVMMNGVLVERELLEPLLADPLNTGEKMLLYTYQRGEGRAFVPHEQIQPTGQDWSWILWNPETGEYHELDQSIT